MKVLVACEYSGVVRDAFIKKGHDAMSCDLLPTERPGPHYQGDVYDVIDDGWDLMIAHPPCTYLCSSGLHWNKKDPSREKKTHESMLFVLNLMGEGFIAHGIPKIALENPVGRIGTAYRKADQIIHPYQFGHDASKQTCLWLKGLPPLRGTQFIEPRWVCCGNVIDIELVGKYGCSNCLGEKKPLPRWGNQCDSGQNNVPSSKDRWKIRSTTYQGIADAMADQWGSILS